MSFEFTNNEENAEAANNFSLPTAEQIEQVEQAADASENSSEEIVAAEELKTAEELIAAEAQDDVVEDMLWQARTGLNPDSLCGAIETIIFMSDKPVPLLKIRNYIDQEMPLRVVHEAILRLQEEYEIKHHGIRLQEVAQGYQFRTKATYSKYVQDIFKVNTLVLGPTALEVLAIIAYKGPVSRTEIEKIRGVDSSHIIRVLMDKRLVCISGRSEELGRPSLYSTTLEFLEVFNLSSLQDLPSHSELESIADRNDIGKIQDIKSLVSTGDKRKFVFDELQEIDLLGQSIKSIKSDTSFTKLLQVEDKKRTTPTISEGGVVEPVKSAFELLEEYLHRIDAENEMKNAATSELVTSVAEGHVIRPEDLDQEHLNAPVIESDTDEENMPLSLEQEKEDLSLALDKAFEQLTNSFEKSKFSSESEEDLIDDLSDFADLDEKEKQLEALHDQIIDQGQELDLNLELDLKTEDALTETEKEPVTYE